MPSQQIPGCHFHSLYSGDSAWRVQRRAVLEHVPDWWRRGGCGIEKRATSEVILFSSSYSVTQAVRLLSVTTRHQQECVIYVKCVCVSVLKQDSGSGTLFLQIRCDLIRVNDRMSSLSPNWQWNLIWGTGGAAFPFKRTRWIGRKITRLPVRDRVHVLKWMQRHVVGVTCHVPSGQT